MQRHVARFLNARFKSLWILSGLNNQLVLCGVSDGKARYISLAKNVPRDTLHKEGVPLGFDKLGFMLFSFVSVASLPYGVGNPLRGFQV